MHDHFRLPPLSSHAHPRVGWAVVRGCAVVTGIAALHWSRSQAPVNRKSLLTGRSYELRAKAAFESTLTSGLDQWRPLVQGRLPSADNTLAGFEQNIVPQLDAAYNLARILSGDADAAHDIVQEAFLRAYRSFAGYRGENARALDQMAPRRPVAVHHDRMRAPVITAVDQHARGRRMTTFRRVREDRAYKQDWLEFRV
jgi:Sigma-70 region 2